MNNKYTIIKQESIEELNGTGYLLKHNKTGARVVVVSNEDDNKVFQIGFRTPPTDDTGVPHILEHSVLCGSREMCIRDRQNEDHIYRTQRFYGRNGTHSVIIRLLSGRDSSI